MRLFVPKPDRSATTVGVVDLTRVEAVVSDGVDALRDVVDPVAERFVAAGYRLYLVGGVVRDLVLSDGSSSPPPGDIDLTTDAEPPAIKELLSGPVSDALWSQGERFGTIGATVAGRSIEITTHRAESYDHGSRNPTVTFGRDLGDDLVRRDFTVNAMAVELPSRRLHDPYGGVSDLERKRLQTPLSPEVSFGDDPLRMLRAARFVARLDLTPAPELVEAATAMAERLAIVSIERVTDELERLFSIADPEPGLDFLVASGLLATAVPTLNRSGGDVELAAKAVARLPLSDGGLARRAGLLWPARTEASSELTRLRYSKRDRVRTVRLLNSAERMLGPASTVGTVRRFVAASSVEDLAVLRGFIALISQIDPSIDGVAGRRACDLIDAVPPHDLDDLSAPLSASEIMEILDLDPGPKVGRAQRHLLERRLDEGPVAASEAKRILLEWWRQERDGPDSLR